MPWGDRYRGTTEKRRRGAPRREGWGSRYQAPVQQPHEEKHGGGSFLHKLGHIAGQTLTDFKNTAVNLPGGLYQTASGLIHHPIRTGEAIGRATVEDLRHPLRHPGYTALDLLGLVDVGASTGARLAAAGRLAKAGEAGAARALLRGPEREARFITAPNGETVAAGSYSRAASTRAVQKGVDRLRDRHPEMRFGLRTRAEKVGFERTQNDRVRQALENRPAHALIKASRKLKVPERLALRVVAEEVPLAERIADAEQNLSTATGRTARNLRSHLKLLTQVRDIVHDVKTSDGETVARFKPSAPEPIVHLYEATKTVAHRRQQDLIDAGLLKEETAGNRTSAPGRIVRRDLQPGLSKMTDAELEAQLAPLEKWYTTLVDHMAAAEGQPGDFKGVTAMRNAQAKKLERRGLPPRETVSAEMRRHGESKLLETLRRNPDDPVSKQAHELISHADEIRAELTRRHDLASGVYGSGKEAARALGFDPDLMPELFQNHEGFYVTYKTSKTPKALYRRSRLGSQRQVGIPRKDPTLTHELTGEALRTGDISPDTPRVVAESLLSSNRMLSLWRQRDELQRLAKDAPETSHDIPIRPLWLKGKRWPAEVRDIIDQIDHGNLDEPSLRGKLDELARFWLPKHLSDEEAEKIPGVKWIDERVLDKANVPGPLVGIGQHAGARRALASVDAVNNATKLALVQLKAAYAAPNIGGNLLLLTAQQGVFAPANLARAVRLTHKLGVEDATAIDTLMGEGITQSILHNPGPLSRVVEKVGRFWNPLVDLPFRRAAFLHEARLAGFKSAEDLTRLLNDGSLQDDLIRVTRQANRAIIDYSRLGPVEQDIIRRVLFLYPWVKGSTVYAGHFLAEHPIQAAFAAQLGAEQKLRQEATLGPLPSWAEALFKVGGGPRNPLVSNPSAIAILQTPATVLETARRAFTGGGGSAYDIANQLSPVAGAAVAAVSRKDPFSGYNYPRKTSAADIFAKQIYGGAPQLALAKRLLHPNQATYVFPTTRREAVMQFLLGGAAPRRVNLAALNAKALAEQQGR